LIKEFYRKRPKDINLNILVSGESVKQDFYIIDSTTLNTSSEDEAHRLEGLGYKIKYKIEIHSITVPEIINKPKLLPEKIK